MDIVCDGKFISQTAYALDDDNYAFLCNLLFTRIP